LIDLPDNDNTIVFSVDVISVGMLVKISQIKVDTTLSLEIPSASSVLIVGGNAREAGVEGWVTTTIANSEKLVLADTGGTCVDSTIVFIVTAWIASWA